MKKPKSNPSISDLMALREFAKQELEVAHRILEKAESDPEKLAEEDFRTAFKTATERGIYFSLFLDHTTAMLGGFCTDVYSLDEANDKAVATFGKFYPRPPVSPTDVN